MMVIILIEDTSVILESLLYFQDKLSWIFKAFDKDGGGSIDKEEIR